MNQDRRHDDSKLNYIMELMSTNHESTVSMIMGNRRHSDAKFSELIKRMDSEIPEGHGIYHRKLIEEAARRQAMQDAIKHKVLGWIAVGILSAMTVAFTDVWSWLRSHIK